MAFQFESYNPDKDTSSPFSGFGGVNEASSKKSEEWGDDSDESDIEPELYDKQDDETSPPSQQEGNPEQKGFVGQNDAGFGALAVDKAFDITQQQLQKRRWITIKILNKSSKVLQEPHWVFKDGKTEVNPVLYIEKDGGEGEARFKGRTLKGALSYEISDTAGSNSSDRRVVIVFKVLYFRGFEVGKWVQVGSGRANQVGIKTIKRKGSKWTETKSGEIYKIHKGCLKENSGEYHTHESGGLKFRYTISDTGDAEVKVVVIDA